MTQPASLPVFDLLLRDLADQHQVLPTLPDIARKIQRMIDDISFSASQIVAEISGDPSIAAQVIRNANSGPPGQGKADSVRTAVALLGYKKLRELLGLIIDQSELAQSRHPLTGNFLHRFWEHSREVATYSYILAKKLKLPNPEQAMLAGLVHQIGALPLCLQAGKLFPQLNRGALDSLLWDFRATTSSRLLRAWNFPEEIVAAVSEHEDMNRSAADSAPPGYSDIVAVASLLGRDTAHLTVWERIKPARRLGLSPSDCADFNEKFQSQIQAARKTLFAH